MGVKGFKQKVWTEADLQLLVDLFPHQYTKVVAEKLGCTYSVIVWKASKMGLKKDPNFRKEELQRQGERLKEIGKKSRFEKGAIPANKGKKMSKETRAKAKHTFYKKGHLPHNTKHDGHERLSTDGYMMIRVELGKYVLKHRWLWEQENGKIPKGKILVFKNGNPLDLTLDNLELITRKELMNKNSIMRFPPELRKTIKLVHKLKREINAKEQD